MKHCQNCGAAVTEQYARVFASDEEKGVEVCPRCPDMKRGPDGRAREVRSQRNTRAN